MAMKPLLPPQRKIRVEQQMARKRELDWDNRFVLGRINDQDRQSSGQKRKPKPQPLIEQPVRERNDLLKPQSNQEQQVLKITRGREKCIYLLMKVVKEAQSSLDEQNIMDFVRRVSELISHLRILTINFVEQFSVWKCSTDNGEYRYQEWIYHDYNYLRKISDDTNFLRQVNLFCEFFHFSDCEDPFFLSLIGQAIEGNTDFDDYLLQHKLPKSIIRRIRRCELVLLEESYQRKLHSKNSEDFISRPPGSHMSSMNRMLSPTSQFNNEDPHNSGSGQKYSASKPPSATPSKTPSLPASQTVTLNPILTQTPSKTLQVPPLQSPPRNTAPPSQLPSTQQTQSQAILKRPDPVQLPPNLKVLLQVGDLKLCTLPTPITQLEERLKQVGSDEVYLQSFRKRPELCLYGQEACLLYFYQGSKYVGVLSCFIDSGCVTVRRWIIHFALGQTRDLFCKMVELFLQVVENDPYEELQVSLQHYDQEGKFQECKEFKDQLKTMLFKWKQFINEYDSRYTIYQAKRQTQRKGVPREPIVCQIGRYARPGKAESSTNVTCEDISIGYYCNSLGALVEPTPILKSLATHLSRVKFSGIRYQVTKNNAEFSDFIRSAQHPFELPLNTEGTVQTQILNLCLRWQHFSVEHLLIGTRDYKYIRIPSVPSLFDEETDTVIELKSSDASDSASLFLIETMDSDILFFLFDMKNPLGQEDVQQRVESIFERYDQKRKYEGDLWVPTFSYSSSMKSLPGVNLLNRNFANQSFFSIDYSEQLKSITNVPGAKSTIFKGPYLAGFIKKDLYESISKPINVAIITEKNFIAYNPIPPPQYQKGGISFRTAVLGSERLEEKMDQFMSASDESYLKSFNSSVPQLARALTLEQEATLLEVQQDGTFVGGITMFIDKGCVTARRWQVQTVMLRAENLFDAVLNHFIAFVYESDPAADEIYIYLRHYSSLEDPQKLVSNKSFQETFKKAGFKWKQQINDASTGTRMITFQHRRAQRSVEASFPEPLQLKSCYALSERTLTNFLDVKEADIKLGEMMFHMYAKTAQSLQMAEKDDNDLLEKVLKLKQNLPATRQSTLAFRDVQEFFTLQDQRLMVIPGQNSTQDQFACQLTNIQLRWIEAREVMIENRQFIEFPKNESEYVIRGKNEFLKEPVYLVSTSDPKFTVFYVECKDPDELADIRSNVSFYSSAIAQFTDSKEMVDCDLLVPTCKFSRGGDGFCVVIDAGVPSSVTNCLYKEVQPNSVVLRGSLLMGLIHEEVVDKFNVPLVSVIVP